ncbi:hypothetical protein Slin15195_G050840 [Septoria linicola]|uniref:Uncharacterized protein n=1 Tax=Septoria linicola TaxID=215465 RepID=A0A9Q9EI85_9PEZI|nr:hypothetical protein Slin15195_G050840 [Septoria linicola]
MSSLKQKVIGVLAALIVLSTTVVGLPTVNATETSRKALAEEPLTCFGPGLAADPGLYMKSNAVNFCQIFDTATLKKVDTINSKAYQADNGVYYNFQMSNFMCETDYLDVEECYNRLYQVLDVCNGGDSGRNVGGIVSTDCGQMIVLPSTQKNDPPTARSDEASLAARTITETGCNPPVWSACTPLEKKTMLKQACDYRLCLVAGNCDVC